MKQIYLVDDEPAKQRHFARLFEQLPKSAGFEAPWGLEADDNARRSTDARELLDILTKSVASDVLFLLDLQLRCSPERLLAFEDAINESPVFRGTDVVEKGKALLDHWHSVTRANKDLYGIAAYFMCCARHRQMKVIVASTLAGFADMSFLSRTGLADVPNTAFPFSDDQESFDVWANLIQAQVQPLVQLREQTRHWFYVNPPDHRYWPDQSGRFHLPHDYLPDRLGENRLNQYKSAVKAVFPNSPDVWFSDDAAVTSYHVTMKHFLGSASEFGLPPGDRSVCLAAVHHLLLIATGFYSGQEVPAELISDWSAFTSPEGTPVPFFPPYSYMSGVSKTLIVDVLFDLHDLLAIMSINKHTRRPCVAKVVYPTKSRLVYSINFSWEEQDVDKFLETVSKTIDGLLTTDRPAQTRGKAAVSLARIMIALQLCNVRQIHAGSRIELRRGSPADGKGLWVDFHAGAHL